MNYKTICKQTYCNSRTQSNDINSIKSRGQLANPKSTMRLGSVLLLSKAGRSWWHYATYADY
jgi:hypothetical protein